MKILQICLTKIVNSAGGAEKVYCNMGNYFCEEHEIIDVCNDEEEGVPFYHIDKRIKFINISVGSKIKIPFTVKLKNEIVRLVKKIGARIEFPKEVYVRRRIYSKFKKILEDEQPDIIVCYELRSMVLVAECGYPLSKIILMFHMSSEIILKSLSNRQKEILRNVAKIQVLLASDKERLKQLGFENVVVIGNVVPQYEIFDEVDMNKTIIHVGRLDKNHKRQHLLIEAFAKIAHKYPQWQVKFFGGDSKPSGYERELLKKIENKKLEKQVFIMGKSNNVAIELQKAAIFAFPSAYEGFPLAMTEAMACGLPIVAFKTTPAVNELVCDDRNGILCDESIDSFADVLEELMKSDEKRKKYGKQAKIDMEKYKEKIIYGKWEMLFYDILKNK